MTEAGPLVLILLMLVIFWVLLVRPQRVQQKRLRELQDSLVVGDRVILSAGIHATIRSIDEARAEVEIAPGTVVTVARQVLVNRIEEPGEPEGPRGSTSSDVTDASGGAPDQGPEQAPDQAPGRGRGPGAPGTQG